MNQEEKNEVEVVPSVLKVRASQELEEAIKKELEIADPKDEDTA